MTIEARLERFCAQLAAKAEKERERAASARHMTNEQARQRAEAIHTTQATIYAEIAAELRKALAGHNHPPTYGGTP